MLAVDGSGVQNPVHFRCSADEATHPDHSRAIARTRNQAEGARQDVAHCNHHQQFRTPVCAHRFSYVRSLHLIERAPGGHPMSGDDASQNSTTPRPTALERSKSLGTYAWASLVAAATGLTVILGLGVSLVNLKAERDKLNKEVTTLQVNLAKLRQEMNQSYEKDFLAIEESMLKFEDTWEPLRAEILKRTGLSPQKLDDQPYQYQKTVDQVLPKSMDKLYDRQARAVRALFTSLDTCLENENCSADAYRKNYCSRSKEIIMQYYRFTRDVTDGQMNAKNVYEFLAECAAEYGWTTEVREDWYHNYVNAGGEDVLHWKS